MFDAAGYPYMLGASGSAALIFALALQRRSWPLWLLGFVLTIAALFTAWYFRESSQDASVLAVLAHFSSVFA